MNFASAADVTSALTRVANAPSLLVVSDFDGTLAGFSTDPYDVPICDRSITALQALSTLNGTTTAILSGRHREGLERVSGAPEGIILAGSHGADAHVLTPEQADALQAVTKKLEQLVEGIPGAFIEYKPFNCVMHYRAVEGPRQEQLVRAASAIDIPGAKQIQGKFVIEYTVVDITKGTWITEARNRYAADAVIFLGDDITDENGFRALGPSDLGVRVGEGETAAHIRIPGVEDVADVLEELVQLRGAATVEPAQ
ncbi:trehalose-phosphatase [Staphylococcus chromogenes]|nr:trehalose-phosphatase [Staphylococcus chromogenes]